MTTATIRRGHVFVERADRHEAPFFPHWLYCTRCGMSKDFADHSRIPCRSERAAVSCESGAQEDTP